MTNYINIANRVTITAIALMVVSQTYALELAQDNAPSQPPPRRTNRAPAPPQPAQPQSPAAAQSQNQPQSPAPQQPASTPPPAPVPQRTEILRFDNWTVTCNEFAEPSPRMRGEHASRRAGVEPGRVAVDVGVRQQPPTRHCLADSHGGCNCAGGRVAVRYRERYQIREGCSASCHLHDLRDESMPGLTA